MDKIDKDISKVMDEYRIKMTNILLYGFPDKPSADEYKKMMETVKTYGEPIDFAKHKEKYNKKQRAENRYNKRRGK